MAHIEVSSQCVAIVGISGADTMLYLVRCEMKEKKRNEALKEHIELLKERIELADELNEEYKKQIELLTEFRLRTMRILAGLCNDVDYRDQLLSNPAFIEYINDEYAKLTTERLLKKSPAD